MSIQQVLMFQVVTSVLLFWTCQSECEAPINIFMYTSPALGLLASSARLGILASSAHIGLLASSVHIKLLTLALHASSSR